MRFVEAKPLRLGETIPFDNRAYQFRAPMQFAGSLGPCGRCRIPHLKTESSNGHKGLDYRGAKQMQSNARRRIFLRRRNAFVTPDATLKRHVRALEVKRQSPREWRCRRYGEETRKETRKKGRQEGPQEGLPPLPLGSPC